MFTVGEEILVNDSVDPAEAGTPKNRVTQTEDVDFVPETPPRVISPNQPLEPGISRKRDADEAGIEAELSDDSDDSDSNIAQTDDLKKTLISILSRARVMDANVKEQKKKIKILANQLQITTDEAAERAVEIDKLIAELHKAREINTKDAVTIRELTEANEQQQIQIVRLSDANAEFDEANAKLRDENRTVILENKGYREGAVAQENTIIMLEGKTRELENNVSQYALALSHTERMIATKEHVIATQAESLVRIAEASRLAGVTGSLYFQLPTRSSSNSSLEPQRRFSDDDSPLRDRLAAVQQM